MAEMPLGLHLLLSASALFARPCAKAQARAPLQSRRDKVRESDPSRRQEGGMEAEGARVYS